MVVKRKALGPDAFTADYAVLRGRCMGCKNCSGVCFDLVQFLSLPKLVLERREARS